jgi:signal transduction histidine kinase/ligand-binding sensor domain-containing protein/DNA-binding response OmpR family regulator
MLGAGCCLQAVYFRHLGMRDGLAHISVMSIYQDELGRMWFGTEEGLSMYDGNDVTSYKHMTNSLRPLEIGNHNYPVTGDGNGNIYFRSDRKLMHYDVGTETFRCLKSENVRTVFCRDSLTLVAAGDTVYEWSQREDAFRYVLDMKMTGCTISELFVDAQSRLWIGTNRGLYLREGAMRCIVREADISGLAQDSRSVLWIATRTKGIFRYDCRTALLTKIEHSPDTLNSIPHNQVRSFAEDNCGNIWIGTFAGLCRYEPATNRYTTYEKDGLPGSLKHSSVFSTFKDRQGNIWVGTYYGGVHFFHPTADPFTHYASDATRTDCLSHFFVGKMAEDGDGNLWICTEGGGLNFFDRRNRTFRHFLAGDGGSRTNSIPHNHLKSITYSPKYNRLYIGTYTGGLSICDVAGGRFRNLRDTNPTGHREIGDVIIRTQFFGADTLLIHSRRGLFVMDAATEQVHPLAGSDSLAAFSAFFVDARGFLWLANASAIVRIEMNRPASRHTFDRAKNGLGTSEVSCISEDREGRVLFGTLGAGLFAYDGACGRFSACTVENGLLLSNYCYEIARSTAASAAGRNELIISGDRGLSFLDAGRKTLRTVRLDALIFSGINRSNGLLACRDGEVFVGGIGGLTSFFEQNVFRDGDGDCGIYFSSLSVNNERITPGDGTEILDRALPFTDRIVLPHDRNNILIRFASNNYTRPPATDAFEYRLEGFDDGWVTDDDVRYTSLRPGKYHLTVREKSADARPPASAAAPSAGAHGMIALDIVVLYPWYAHPLAVVLYVIAGAAVVYAFIRFRRTKLRLKNSLETAHRDRERIEQFNDAKLQFFSNVSHEFNTPLTLIIAQTERLLGSGATSPFVYNKLLQIRKQAVYLRNLIGELLDFNNPAGQERIRLRASRQNLVPFLREVYLPFCELAAARNIAYAFRPAGDEILCRFDARQMRKVFYNLLSNAFKCTGRGDTIELSVEEAGEAVKIEVMDSGIGISREDIGKIFDRFYRAGNDACHSPGRQAGTGIGLSVVKNIVELHHGTITVESKPSYGSIFIVTLPKDGAIAGTEESPETALARVPAGPAVPADAPDREKYTLLIVEDNEELRHILHEIFRPMYNILLAGDGKTGLQTVRQAKPDIVISDIMMPGGMSGTEMCAAIKNDFETCHIPVILLTALSSAEQNIAGFRHGADDYISKPFDEKTLVAHCNSLIRNRAIIRSKFGRHAADTGVPALPNNPADQKFLDTIIRIIDGNLDNPDFNINILARELNTSRSSLYAKFEAMTGLTPNDFVLQRKLRKAAVLLRNSPELNISEIADRSGFSSPRYFSRCFKKQYSVSPLEYRKKSQDDAVS